MIKFSLRQFSKYHPFLKSPEPINSSLLTSLLNINQKERQSIPDWSHTYFKYNQKITLPLVSLQNKTVNLNEQVNLPHSIFNTPIRMDLIHKVFLYNKAYHEHIHKWTKSKGEVSGSGKKPFKQKGLGRARQGNKRAAQLYKGGHVFALRPRSLYIQMNKKMRLYGLKSLLTYMLIERKIVVVDSLKGEEGKVNFDKIKDLMNGRKTIVYMTSQDNEDLLFKEKDVNKVRRKLKTMSVVPVGERSLNVYNLLNSDFLLFSKDSISDLISVLTKRYENYFRITKKYKSIEKRSSPVDSLKFDFDPNSELVIYTPALKGSMKRMETFIKDRSALEEYVQKRYDQRNNQMMINKKKRIEEVIKRTEENLLKKKAKAKGKRRSKK